MESSSCWIESKESKDLSNEFRSGLDLSNESNADLLLFGMQVSKLSQQRNQASLSKWLCQMSMKRKSWSNLAQNGNPSTRAPAGNQVTLVENKDKMLVSAMTSKMSLDTL